MFLFRSHLPLFAQNNGMRKWPFRIDMPWEFVLLNEKQYSLKIKKKSTSLPPSEYNLAFFWGFLGNAGNRNFPLGPVSNILHHPVHPSFLETAFLKTAHPRYMEHRGRWTFKWSCILLFKWFPYNHHRPKPLMGDLSKSLHLE